MSYSQLSVLGFCMAQGGLEHAVTCHKCGTFHLILYLMQGVSQNLKLTNWLCWWPYEPQNLPVSAPWTQCTTFHMGAEHPNADLHACLVSTPLTGHLPVKGSLCLFLYMWEPEMKRITLTTTIHDEKLNIISYPFTINHNHWCNIGFDFFEMLFLYCLCHKILFQTVLIKINLWKNA